MASLFSFLSSPGLVPELLRTALDASLVGISLIATACAITFGLVSGIENPAPESDFTVANATVLQPYLTAHEYPDNQSAEDFNREVDMWVSFSPSVN